MSRDTNEPFTRYYRTNLLQYVRFSKRNLIYGFSCDVTSIVAGPLVLMKYEVHVTRVSC